MKKILSTVLVFSIVFLSMVIPQVSAADEYDVKYLSDNFIRIENTEPAFEAGVARSFTVDISAAGDYAIFVGQTGPVKTAIQADFAQTAEVTGGDLVFLSVGDLKTESDGYKNTYSRIGAVAGKSESVALYAGACTVTVTSSVAATIPYIDIKCTDVTLNGGKRAIYPGDYTTYSYVGYYGHINGEMCAGDNHDLIAGYDYWGDLSDTALSAPYAKTRKIHFNGGTNGVYTLNVTKAGNYNLSILANYYAYNVSTEATEDKSGSMVLFFDESEIYKHEDTIPCKANGGTNDHLPDHWHNPGTIFIPEGTHTLQIASNGFGTYVKHILFEEVVESNDKIVNVDNNLTRIEIDAATKTIEDGALKVVEFSVPVSGNYIFYVYKTKDYAGTISTAIINKSSMENVFAYNDKLLAGKQYVKVGKSTTLPVLLEQDVKYELTVASNGAAIDIDYIDVMCVDLPVNGKTSIPSHYAVNVSDMDDGHLNNTDQAKNMPTPGYALIGDFNSELLSSRRETFPISLQLDNGKWIEYSLDVKTPGLYSVKIVANTYPSGGPVKDSEEIKEINEQLKYSVNGTLIGTVPYSNNTADDLIFTMPSVYLGAGNQTIRFDHPATPKIAGFYFKEILIDPSTESNIIDATTLPAEFNGTSISSITGSTSGRMINLNAGESVTFKFKSGAFDSADLKMIESAVPQNASVTYVMDEEAPQTVTINQLGKIFEAKDIAEGPHTITITSNTAGVGIARLLLCEHSDDIAQGTTIDVPARSIRTAIGLDYGVILGGTAVVDPDNGVYTITGPGEYQFKLNIADGGYYTMYANAMMYQNSFTISIDGNDVTTKMYQDTSNPNNIRDSLPVKLKRLSNPIYLNAGEHEFIINVLDGNFAEIHNMELQRTDGPISTDITNETIIPAWNHSSWRNLSNGWYFPHQDGQGGKLTVGIYSDLRNIVVEGSAEYTFDVTVEESGYYNYGLYYTNPENQTVFHYVIDDVTYELSGTSGSTTKLSSTEAIYLEKGKHTVTISKKSSAGGTVRVFALTFAKSTGNVITLDTAASKATFEVDFGKTVTGTVITALYQDNQLVGVVTTSINEKQNVVVGVPYNSSPDTAKVMVWGNLINIKPIEGAATYTSASPEWKTK